MQRKRKRGRVNARLVRIRPVRLFVVLLLSFALWLLPVCLPIYLSFGFSLSANQVWASSLSDIQKRGFIRVAVKDNTRPLGFRDAQNNLQGLEIDLAQRLAQDLIKKPNHQNQKNQENKPNAVKFFPVSNRDRLGWVLENKVDLAIARVTATESRSRLVNFSIPYYLDSAVLIVKNNSLQRLADFKDRTIAVLRGSSTMGRVKYLISNARIIGVNSYTEAYQLLETGQVEAFAADSSILAGWVQKYPGYRLIDTRLSTEPLAIVLPKGLQHDELRREINQAIARYLADGWLQQRITAWGLLPSQLKISRSESDAKVP